MSPTKKVKRVISRNCSTCQWLNFHVGWSEDMIRIGRGHFCLQGHILTLQFPIPDCHAWKEKTVDEKDKSTISR